MFYKYFTSESVCAGHPDKICDQISDAIVDEALRQDKQAKVAVETVVKDRIILVGELSSAAKIDYESIVKTVVQNLGYDKSEWGFSVESPIEIHINQQSPEIAEGVGDDAGAGDQGMMFGFASRETEQLMPLPITLAHAITRRIDEVRELEAVDWLRPDGKAQVTVDYTGAAPRVAKVVVAVAHDEKVTSRDRDKYIYEMVVQPVIDQFGLDMIKPDQLIVNGTGEWYIPGPASDAGLTGRKIVVDSYGGFARVGGGAFSGKDPSKVDRSGAYAARFLAKNIVAAGLAEQCEAALAYCIGKPKPVMVAYDLFGTAKVAQSDIEEFASKLLDLSVKGIIDGLDLRRSIYQPTATYGHFGHHDYPWEQIVKSL